MPETTVINIRTRPNWRKEGAVYIGRGSPYGNPFKITTHSRKEVIELYRYWFAEQLKDPEFRAAVLRLKGKELACYCVPLPCHGQVIKEWLDGIDNARCSGEREAIEDGTIMPGEACCGNCGNTFPPKHKLAEGEAIWCTIYRKHKPARQMQDCPPAFCKQWEPESPIGKDTLAPDWWDAEKNIRRETL